MEHWHPLEKAISEKKKKKKKKKREALNSLWGCCWSLVLVENCDCEQKWSHKYRDPRMQVALLKNSLGAVSI